VPRALLHLGEGAPDRRPHEHLAISGDRGHRIDRGRQRPLTANLVGHEPDRTKRSRCLAILIAGRGTRRAGTELRSSRSKAHPSKEDAMANALRPVDADNHYYESLDAFTRHLDPEFKRRGVRAVLDGTHVEMVIAGKVNHF